VLTQLEQSELDLGKLEFYAALTGWGEDREKGKKKVWGTWGGRGLWEKLTQKPGGLREKSPAHNTTVTDSVRRAGDLLECRKKGLRRENN